MVDEVKIERVLKAGSDKPTSDVPLGEVPENPKTLAEVSAEHPEWAGTAQLASAAAMENPPPQLEGLAISSKRGTSPLKD